MAYKLDPAREAAALELLKAEFAAHADDPDFVLSLAEGQTNLLEAMDGLLLADAHDDGLIDGIKSAVDELKRRSERIASRKAYRRGLLERCMAAVERKKLELPSGTVSVASVAPKVDIWDEDKIPEDYLVPKVSPDMKKIKEALQSGEVVPGARMTNGSTTIRVQR